MRTPGKHPRSAPQENHALLELITSPYRMLHAYGAKFVKRLRKLRVAIVGARGVAVEVAKCLTLSGARLLHVFDDEHVRARDLGSNFALQPSDVGKPRAAATVPFLQQLNESVSVSVQNFWRGDSRCWSGYRIYCLPRKGTSLRICSFYHALALLPGVHLRTTLFRFVRLRVEHDGNHHAMQKRDRAQGRHGLVVVSLYLPIFRYWYCPRVSCSH